MQLSIIGTKAQQALKMQQEQKKLEQKSIISQKAQEEKQRQFELHQQKRKKNIGTGKNLLLLRNLLWNCLSPFV